MAGLEERVTKSFVRRQCHNETETKKQINTIMKSNVILGELPVVMVLLYLYKIFSFQAFG